MNILYFLHNSKMRYENKAEKKNGSNDFVLIWKADKPLLFEFMKLVLGDCQQKKIRKKGPYIKADDNHFGRAVKKAP